MTDSVHPYDRHVGRYGSALATELIRLAGIKPGDRVLDVGCGTGQLTKKLAAVAGGENVAALDPSLDAVEVCRVRAPDADVRVGSAEALPFAESEFDAAVAQLVVNLVDDPPAAVREMARVVRPGAPVAACVWDDEEMPLLRSFWDAAAAAAPEEVARVDDQARVGLGDLALLQTWWAAAGLEQLTLDEFEVTADYESFEDLWVPFESGVGHSGGLYASLSPSQQAATRAAAQAGLGSPQGSFQLTARVHAVSGLRPKPPR